MPRSSRSSGRSSSPARSAGVFGSRSSSSAAPARTAPAPKAAPPPAAPAARQAPPPAAAPQPPPPAQHQAQQAPPPQMQQPQGGGGMLSGLMGTVAQGMAFGTGSAVANRAVDAVMGPRTINVEHSNGQKPAEAAPAADPAPPRSSQICGEEAFDFNQCMKKNNMNLEACNFYMDILKQCQFNNKQSMSM